MKKYLSVLISAFALAACFAFAGTAYAAQSVALTSQNTTVVLSEKKYTYDGAQKTPTATVYYNGVTLASGTDYSVSYVNNTDAGTATATVTGAGNYTGSVTASFTISQADISASGKTKVTFEKSSLIYVDKDVIPIMYVSYDKGGDVGEQYLIQDVDYTVTYSGNTSAGNAKAKITGIGNYKGSVTKSFTVKPNKVASLSIGNVSSDSLTLKWSKVNKITGYQIYKYDSKKKKYTLYKTVSSKYTSYKIGGLNSSKSYSFKVRAYKTVGKTKLYGEYSAVAGTMIKPAKVQVTSVTSDGSKLTVEWKKVNCTGYEIFYSTDSKLKKNVKTVKVKGSSKKSKVIKNIKSGKKYYVKVRAYTVYNGKTYNGPRSAVLSNYFSNVYATYYSYYENNANRTTNLRLASKEINGTIIQPGDYFDFNDVVGPRTAAKGYKSAHVFAGEQVVSGIGGGICQVASTMFNCALKANVEIAERHQHNQRVSYVPLGRDAAISGTAQNFRWKNNTKYAIKIKMTVKNGVITCTFYTCKKAKPKKVNLSVSQNGKNFYMKRTVDGKVNYSCSSYY